MLVALSATLMLVYLFVAVMKATVSFAIMQLEVSATLTQVKVSAANMWVTIFIEIMQVGVCCNHVRGMYMTICIMHMTIYIVSVVAMYVSSSNFTFRFLTSVFHKIYQKTFKGI